MKKMINYKQYLTVKNIVLAVLLVLVLILLFTVFSRQKDKRSVDQLETENRHLKELYDKDSLLINLLVKDTASTRAEIRAYQRMLANKKDYIIVNNKYEKIPSAVTALPEDSLLSAVSNYAKSH